MGRHKSLLARATVDVAQRSHNCQHSAAHRIQTGDRRLKVAVQRTHEHFCVACALAMVRLDMVKLQQLEEALQSSTVGGRGEP